MRVPGWQCCVSVTRLAGAQCCAQPPGEGGWWSHRQRPQALPPLPLPLADVHGRAFAVMNGKDKYVNNRFQGLLCVLVNS